MFIYGNWKKGVYYEKLRKMICPFKNLFKPYIFHKDGTYVFYDKFSVLYIGIAKNANSTINAAFLKAMDIKPDKNDRAGKVHDLKMPFVISKWQAYFLKSKYKIAFVRNPFERLVSCYVNKIKEENYWGIKKCYYGLFNSSMSFQEFVERVCAIPDFASDIHFRSQSSFLFLFGKPLFDELGKVENLDEDYKKLLYDRFDLPPKESYNVSNTDDWRKYYSKDLAVKVYKRYKKDFKNFSYNKELDKLINYLDNTN